MAVSDVAVVSIVRLPSQADAPEGRGAVEVRGSGTTSIKEQSIQCQQSWVKARGESGTELRIPSECYTKTEEVFPEFLAEVVSMLRLRDENDLLTMSESTDLLIEIMRAKHNLRDPLPCFTDPLSPTAQRLHDMMFNELDQDGILRGMIKFGLKSLPPEDKKKFDFLIDHITNVAIHRIFYKSIGGKLVPKGSQVRGSARSDMCASFALRPWLGNLVDAQAVREVLTATDSMGNMINTDFCCIWKDSIEMLGFVEVADPSPDCIIVYCIRAGPSPHNRPWHWGVVKSIDEKGIPLIMSKFGFGDVFDHAVNMLCVLDLCLAMDGVYVRFFCPPLHMPSDQEKKQMFKKCLEASLRAKK